MKSLRTIGIGFSLFCLSLPLTAQEQQLAFVRGPASLIVVDEFAPGDNQIDFFPTDTTPFRTALPFQDFLDMLQNAVAQGLGGVVDFESPVYSGALLDVDRTMVVRELNLALERVATGEEPLGPDETLQMRIDRIRAEIYERLDILSGPLAPVINRRDSAQEGVVNDIDLNTINFDQLVAVYGTELERRLRIRRGPLNRNEGELARFERVMVGGTEEILGGTVLRPGNPQFDAIVKDPAQLFPLLERAVGRETLQSINDNYWWNIGTGGYLAGSEAISGINSLQSGVIDMLIDPRDNVIAVGFVLLNANNFQYYQGPAAPAVVVNPNNKRVYVEFSDGTSDLLYGTTGQDPSLHDHFFGIQAPEGASITRIVARAIGRNWRTFVFMDDFAFITAPALPFISSPLASSGSVGASFFYRLDTEGSPTTVTVSGLPAGLSFNADTRTIAGTPSVEGVFSLTVTMTNDVGTSEEVVELTILAQQAEEVLPVLTGPTSAGVTVGRDLVPVEFETGLSEAAARQVQYTSLVFRVNSDGSRTQIPLAELNISLADGQMTGTPTLARQVGEFEIAIYAFNRFGASRLDFVLSIFPVVATPNLDGDPYTDIVFQTATGTYALLGQHLPGDAPLPSFTRINIANTSNSRVVFGDFNVNNQTDILIHSTSANNQILNLMNGLSSTQAILMDAMTTGWTPLGFVTLPGLGDGGTLWRHNDGSYLIQTVVRDYIAWSGRLFTDSVVRELVLMGDFNGSGFTDFLFRRADGTYEFVEIRSLTSQFTITRAQNRFSIDPSWKPVFASDLTGNGRTDLVWFNTVSGEYTFWPMTAVAPPASALVPVSADEEVPDVRTIAPQNAQPLLPRFSQYALVGLLDTNEDQRNDLILQHRTNGQIAIMMMGETGPSGEPVYLFPGQGNFRVVAMGDYNGDKRNDLLLRDTATDNVYAVFLSQTDVLGTRAISGIPADARFLTQFTINTDLTVPSGANTPVAPFTNALPLNPTPVGDDSDRWFFVENFGFLYHDGGDIIFTTQHGFWYIWSQSDVSDDIWAYDFSLGTWFWVNTFGQAYPWMFMLDPAAIIGDGWVFFFTNTRTPSRWFAVPVLEDFGFDPVIGESDLRDIINGAF